MSVNVAGKRHTRAHKPRRVNVAAAAAPSTGEAAAPSTQPARPPPPPPPARACMGHAGRTPPPPHAAAQPGRGHSPAVRRYGRGNGASALLGGTSARGVRVSTTSPADLENLAYRRPRGVRGRAKGGGGTGREGHGRDHGNGHGLRWEQPGRIGGGRVQGEWVKKGKSARTWAWAGEVWRRAPHAYPPPHTHTHKHSTTGADPISEKRKRLPKGERRGRGGGGQSDLGGCCRLPARAASRAGAWGPLHTLRSQVLLFCTTDTHNQAKLSRSRVAAVSRREVRDGQRKLSRRVGQTSAHT
jgi:hypothetical protein